MLFDAKRENVGLQLEAAYRERLAQVHSEVRLKCGVWGAEGGRGEAESRVGEVHLLRVWEREAEVGVLCVVGRCEVNKRKEF